MTTRLKARPTMYKGIQMRSRLEAGFAAWLDRNGVTWEYEPRAYASEEGQYLPDFQITSGLLYDGAEYTDQDLFIEVKPCEPGDWAALSAHRRIMKASGHHLFLVIWPSDNEDGFVMVMPRLREPRPTPRFYLGLVRTPEREYPNIMVPMCRSAAPWFGEWWKPET